MTVAALVAVLAWVGWSALDSDFDRPDAGQPAADVTRDPSALAPSLARALPADLVAPVAPVVKESPPISVRDTPMPQPGQMPFSRSSAVIPMQPAIGPAVALPPGVRVEDVKVSLAGMVTVLRSPVGTAIPSDSSGPGYGAAATPSRPVTLLRSP
jgi:hypothetical protein